MEGTSDVDNRLANNYNSVRMSVIQVVCLRPLVCVGGGGGGKGGGRILIFM